ncbi:MAG: hypothetical protein IKT57_06250 [Clostridia bacterium]|nr:hypothetical protein [Clostridia bacterium]
MLIIGIDGGGTKTDAVLCDESGRVLRRIKGGPSSPTSLGPNKAAENIRQVLAALLKDQGLNTEIDSMFAGLSGGGVGNNPELMKNYLLEMVPNCKVMRNYNDAVNALRSVIPDGDAVSVISGTGSSVFACIDDNMQQIGGWGYLLGDEGSGYDMGRRALMCALKDIDGRGSKTTLTQACAEKLGVPVNKAIPDIYAGGRMLIADFSRILCTEAEKGDKVALEQMKEAAKDLAHAIRTGGERIPFTPKPVATAGSIWNCAMYKKMVQEDLGTEYELRSTDLPPVYGSFVIALRNLGLKVTEEVEKNFRASLCEPENV